MTKARIMGAAQWFLRLTLAAGFLAARGFTRGVIYTREGQLVASVGQDSLMRPESSG